MNLAVRGGIFSADNFGRLAPDVALAIHLADEVLLVINGTEDVVATETNDRDKHEVRDREVDSVAKQVVRLEGVLWI